MFENKDPFYHNTSYTCSKGERKNLSPKGKDGSG